MKLFFAVTFFLAIQCSLFCQTPIKGYYHADKKSIIPKTSLRLDNQTIVPYSLLKDGLRNPGIAFFDGDSLYNSIAFEGPNEYVINQLIESEDNNLLISAEGYSFEGQESIYFMELNNANEVVNSFIFNENGNEVDPFGILENERNILISGFIKERELINNSFFNMYTEQQHIYISEFTKRGEKVWSKSIEIENHNTGISNAIIKYQNNFLMLCHAKDSNDKSSSFIIKLDPGGDIISIIKISRLNSSVSSNIITIDNDEIKIVGTYQDKNDYFLFNYNFDSSLNLTRGYEYNIPNSIVINGENDGYFFGGIISKNEGYNNFILKLDNDKAKYSTFGTVRSEQLIGNNQDILFSYTLSASKELTATINLSTFSKDNFNELKISNNQITVSKELDFKTNSNFTKSSINKGVEKLRVKNNFNQIIFIEK